jgi:uncharacterized protein (DUF433 family)
MSTQTANLLATVETIPLQMDADGVLRIGNTRVPLDTVIAGFMEGATAEELAQQYPSVQLADIYYVIGYYLRRRSEVEVYLEQRRHQAQQVRQQNESHFDPAGVRERLLARQATGKL